VLEEDMSEADWRVVGYIGVTLGVLFLIGSFVAYYFPQDYYFLGYRVSTVYPYRDYSVGLLVAGVALFVVGGGAWWRADMEKQEKKSKVSLTQFSTQFPEYPIPKYSCPSCGRQLRWVQEHQKWYCDQEERYF
jgi:hypothetical protein